MPALIISSDVSGCPDAGYGGAHPAEGGGGGVNRK